MKTIEERLKEHYEEALNLFPQDRIVGIFLQGSQNYELDTENSDVDSKLVVAPSFEDLAFNRKPVSTTHIRKNNEHIDFKDIRLMLQTFRKQNINFIEILFTKYKIVNPLYADLWDTLVINRERIARYCPYSAVATMKGMSLEKYHAMEHPYPSKLEVIEKFGYDPKQLHHLIRFHEFMDRYIKGEEYEKCLISKDIEFLKAIKLGSIGLQQARIMADKHVNELKELSDTFRKNILIEHGEAVVDKDVEKILNDVQLKIMKRAIEVELNRG